MMMVMLLQLNLVFLLVCCFCDASQQHQLLRTSIDDTHDLERHSSGTGRSRVLPAVNQPPSNDECTGAMIIPSTFPGLNYTAKAVSMSNATHSVSGPIFCRYVTKDVWYRFTPALTSYYEFTTNSIDAHIGVYRLKGKSPCNNVVVEACHLYDSLIQYMESNKTYVLAVQPGEIQPDTLQLTVRRHIPPSNTLCTGATTIDPISTTIVTTDNQFALRDEIIYSVNHGCSIAQGGTPMETYWYKLTNPLTTPISIDITHNRDARFRDDVAQVMIFQGTNCTAIRCVGERSLYRTTDSYDFVAQGRTTYYIVLRANTDNFAFNATFTGRTTFFSVIDSQTDKEFKMLTKNLKYYNGNDDGDEKSTSVNLNFQVVFDLPPASIKSVRMTFDNPKRDYCDQKAPYSAFGDINGNYRNATIPLGRHRITATPYSQPNCTGSAAGSTMAQNFNVAGCETYFLIDKDASGFIAALYPATHKYYDPTIATVLSLPCDVEVTTLFKCDFPYTSIRMELRNSTTNAIVKAVTVRNPLGGFASFDIRFPNESYTLTSIINNVVHPSVNFTVASTTACIP